MELSDEIKKKLSALSNDFSNQLDEKFQELERTIGELRTHSNLQKMADIRLMVHKLAGSAATFGFEQLSVRSKEFEVYLEELIEAGTPPDKAQLEKINEYFEYIKEENDAEGTLEELEEFEEEKVELPEDIVKSINKQTTAPESYAKKVYLYGFEGGALEDITRQLGFYGYRVNTLDELSRLPQIIDEKEIPILFVDSLSLDDTGALKQVKSSIKNLLTIVFISDDDTFDLRLRTIRAGGDAFFVRPVDMGKVIDKIDSITSRIKEKPIHVLIVDDDQEQVAYYAFILQQAGMITSVASDPMKVLSILVESKPDLILMDLYMPGCSGIELTKLLRQHEAFITIPIIFLSFENNKNRQLKAIGEGGDDFLIKPIRPDYLISIVKLRAQRNRNLRYFMEHDSLTGLLNHSNLKEQLSREIIRAERSESPLSFAMIDADNFKNVNDTYGHLTGDRVLKSLARILQDRLRRTDLIGRYGGEEFGVILINTTASDAKQIMNEIRENFSNIRHHSEKNSFYVTFSCGIASYPILESPDELNEASDQALYTAKELGRNMVCIYEPCKEHPTGDQESGRKQSQGDRTATQS